MGFGLTFYLNSVVSAITLFYQLMIVTLFAPILGGLLLPKAGRWSALAAMLVGVATLGDDGDRDGRRGLGLGATALPRPGGERGHLLRAGGVLRDLAVRTGGVSPPGRTAA